MSRTRNTHLNLWLLDSFLKSGSNLLLLSESFSNGGPTHNSQPPRSILAFQAVCLFGCRWHQKLYVFVLSHQQWSLTSPRKNRQGKAEVTWLCPCLNMFCLMYKARQYRRDLAWDFLEGWFDEKRDRWLESVKCKLKWDTRTEMEGKKGREDRLAYRGRQAGALIVMQQTGGPQPQLYAVTAKTI